MPLPSCWSADRRSGLAFVAALGATARWPLLLAVPLFRLHGDYFAFASLALLPLLEVPTT